MPLGAGLGDGKGQALVGVFEEALEELGLLAGFDEEGVVSVVRRQLDAGHIAVAAARRTHDLLRLAARGRSGGQIGALEAVKELG